MMRATQKSKATSRAKALGLTVNTLTASAHSPTSGPALVAVRTGNSSTPVIPSTDNSPSTSKVSEALLNPDWRGNRRGPPMTASVEKTEFQKTGGKPVKKLTIDTSSQYGLRRYRDTPIDPDFIHSAPITKKDFEFPEEPESSDMEEYPFSNDDTQPHPHASAIEKPVVKLESLTPATRESFQKGLNWHNLALNRGVGGDGNWHDKWTCNNTPLSAIPCAPTYTEGVQDDTFPIMSVKQIDDSKKLNSRGWTELDQYINKSIAKLDWPRTAGLPPDRLRKEYEESQLALAMKAIVEDPAIQYMETDGRRNGATLLPKPEIKESEEDQARFNALIKKLQQPSIFRLRENPVEDIKSPHLSKESEKSDSDSSGQSSAQDSGISGVRLKSPEKHGTLLNPKASEFHCSSSQYDCGNTSPTDYPRFRDENVPPEPACNGDRSPTDSQQNSSKAVTSEDVQALFACINELKTEIVQMRTASLQAPAPTKQLNHLQDMGNQLNPNPSPYCQPQHVQDPSGYGYGLEASSGVQPGVQPYGGHAFSQRQHIPVTGQFQAPQSVTPDIQSVGPTSYDRPDFNGPVPYTMPPRMDTPQDPQFMVAPQPSQPYPQQASTNSSHLPPHVQAQMMYGPKPVRKPKGPARPGDPRWAKQQQAYEQYLEMKRAIDPNYAMKCKERQARRAGRQRGSQFYNGSNTTLAGAPWVPQTYF